MKLFIIFIFFALLNFNAERELSFRSIREGEIINLYDAFGKDSLLSKDFGFSCITKYKGKTLLFDAGSNADIFKSNVQKIGIDLSKVDLVVVSHGHFDHLNGLDYLLKINPNVKIYFPYDIFWGAPVPFDATGLEPEVKDSLPQYMKYFDGGSTKFSINQSGRFWNSNIEFIKQSCEILPGVKLIATNSSLMGYFSCYPGKSFVEGHFEHPSDNCKNINLPELSLSLSGRNGQTLLVGCSHTGVVDIVRQTMLFSSEKIDLLYGGFHMIPFNREQILKSIQVLKEEIKIARVAPAHCTGHLAFKLFKDSYDDNYLFAGLGSSVE
ncbi:MAG: MBL fold metallo-hydrolase [Saprospiraceae bacterium]|nr:MBL fold metallo-hydrolase [Saprospiraceae bacterium]